MSLGFYIVGSGGHAGVVIAALDSRLFSVSAIMDDTCVGEKRHGFTVQPISDIYPGACYHIAIGDNKIRKSLCDRIGKGMTVVQHYSSSIDCSDKFDLGFGCFLGAHSSVGRGSVVGKGTIINTGALLEHDSRVGEFSHLCPGVVTGGHVQIGSLTMIGLGACIRDRVKIGSNCVIGMGSVVTKDIPDNSVAWGNPCRVIRQCA